MEFLRHFPRAREVATERMGLSTQRRASCLYRMLQATYLIVHEFEPYPTEEGL